MTSIEGMMREFNTQYFDRKEFKCPCKACKGLPLPVIDYELIATLVTARAYFGTPLHILSGQRCEAHNTAVGGSTGSKHMLGMAADIKVMGRIPEEVYAYFNRVYPHSLGLGRYNGHTHVDVRDRAARWDNRKKKTGA